MTAPVFEDRPETTRGRILYRMLLAVHANIRADLTRVEQLATAVLDGLPTPDVDEAIETLRNNTSLWQFQVSCLRYCSFVHLHHHAEDTHFLDELEQTNPAISPVIERLEADHRAVSGHLDTVEAATRTLTTDDSPDARRAVADALAILKQHLLTHLDYEERNVATTTRRLPNLAPSAGISPERRGT